MGLGQGVGQAVRCACRIDRPRPQRQRWTASAGQEGGSETGMRTRKKATAAVRVAAAAERLQLRHETAVVERAQHRSASSASCWTRR